jgi:hypothetical protein
MMDTAPPAPLWRKLLFPCACLLLLAGVAWAQRPDGRLHVYLLAAPGDAALIQTPAGRFVLIDGGRDPAILAMLLGQQLPFWRRNLLGSASLARWQPSLATGQPWPSPRQSSARKRPPVSGGALWPRAPHQQAPCTRGSA